MLRLGDGDEVSAEGFVVDEGEVSTGQLRAVEDDLAQFLEVSECVRVQRAHATVYDGQTLDGDEPTEKTIIVVGGLFKLLTT